MGHQELKDAARENDQNKKYVKLGKQREAEVKHGQERISDLHHENQRLRTFVANMQCKQMGNSQAGDKAEELEQQLQEADKALHNMKEKLKHADKKLGDKSQMGDQME